MLAAQLALLLQPVMEESLTRHHEVKPHHVDILETLGFIVAVKLLQTLVKYPCKLLDVGRLLSKLYHPLVVGHHALAPMYRGSGIFAHLRTGLLTGIVQSLLGIVNDELLAEGIDEALRPAGDDELIRSLTRKAHRVAYHITP